MQYKSWCFWLVTAGKIWSMLRSPIKFLSLESMSNECSINSRFTVLVSLDTELPYHNISKSLASCCCCCCCSWIWSTMAISTSQLSFMRKLSWCWLSERVFCDWSERSPNGCWLIIESLLVLLFWLARLRVSAAAVRNCWLIKCPWGSLRCLPKMPREERRDVKRW